jgi:hypothetical protein
MHPDFYQELTRQHHADLEREASRTRLAASVPHERRLRLTIHARLRVELLGRIDRALLDIEARVARALLDATPADPAASDTI